MNRSRDRAGRLASLEDLKSRPGYPQRWAENETEHTDHGKGRAKKDDNNSYKFDWPLWNELPPLLGIHSRKECMSGLPKDR